MKTEAVRREYVSQFFKGNRLAYSTMLLAAILFSALNLAISWLIQQLMDTVSGAPGSMGVGTLTALAAGMILLIVPLKGLQYAAQPRFLQKAMTQYKRFALEKLTRKNIASFRSEAASTYLSAFFNDLAAIEANYLERQYLLVFNSVWASGAVLLMLAYSPVLTAAAVGFCLLPFAASSAAGARMEQAEKEVSERNAGFMASIKDVLSGFSVVKSFRAENAVLELLEQSGGMVENAKCRKRQIGVLLGMWGGIASLLAQIGTVLVGALMALSGQGVTPGIILIFLNLTGAVISTVEQMPALLAGRRAALALVDKMAAALGSNVRDEGRDIPCELHDGISVRGLRFGYEPDREVLHDIDVVFEAGKSYAIVGGSGSGKSTLLNLLMASHPDYEGAIRFDGTELREISCGSLYGLVSMIEQNVFLFDATVRDNITMFRDFPPEDVDRVIALSGLSELIERRGAQSFCGENGSGLSGGEKQRISIARSLLQNPSVLLADEATAALDAGTAYQVTSDILRLNGITRIVVTHTLTESLLKQYDSIIVLKDGRVAEQGTYEHLMEQKGYFHALYTVAQ